MWKTEGLTLSEHFSLLLRWTCEINPTDLGNFPSGVSDSRLSALRNKKDTLNFLFYFVRLRYFDGQCDIKVDEKS